jgi:hypothetical protein
VVSDDGPAVPSRRALLRIAGTGALASALAGCGSHHSSRKTQTSTTTTSSKPPGPDAATLAPVLDLVHRTTAAYVAGIPLLSGDGANLAGQLFLSQELSHAGELGGLIHQAGGKPTHPRGSYDLGSPSTTTDVLRLLHGLEQDQIAAYIDVLPRLQTPTSRAAVASILANDAQHASILRLLLGREPIPSALVGDHE